MNFEADEALLTGESLPSAKDAGATWDTKGGEGTWDSRDVGVGGTAPLSWPCRAIADDALQIASTWPSPRPPSPRDAQRESWSLLEWGCV